jgi:hypothetical protein
MAANVGSGHNSGFDPKKVQGFVDRVENTQATIDSIMEKARENCAPHRDDIAAIKKEAAENGLSKKEFAAVIRKRRLLDKAENVDRNLDDDQKETFEQMLHALGMLVGTPLADAALDKSNAA